MSEKAADQHDLLSKLKNLALELGRTPHGKEFHRVATEHSVRKLFGNYSAMLQAAGLEPSPQKLPKLDNSIFERSIDAHIESFKPAQVIDHKPYPKIASISDIHWPFSCQRVIDAFMAFIEVFQPEYVFINGDAWDLYCATKFPRSHNVFTPREEMAQARKMNEAFWARVRKVCPNAKCIQMMGNHDVRALKRVMEVFPVAEDWIVEAMTKAFSFDGVETVMDARKEYEIGDILVFHGYRSQLGAHRDYTLFNTINGHTHRGGAVFRHIRGQTIWELNSGLAGDPTGKGLTYTPQKIVEWTPGFGIVDQHGPRFIPA